MEIKTFTASWKCDKCGYTTTFEVADDAPGRDLVEELCVCGIAGPKGNCDGIQRLIKEK